MSQQTRTALFGGWVLMLGVGVGGAIVPAVREGHRLDHELADKRAEAARPVGGPEVISTLSDKLSELRRHHGDRMRPIPRDSNIADLMGSLADELNRLGLTDREVTTGTPTSLDEADSMPMAVKVKGPFPAVYEAVRHIEQLDRLVRVQKFRAATGRASRDDSNRDGIVEAELLIDVFYAPRAVANGSEAR
ncbi:MAG: type 4a pilus biogenesis protein PilO [Phycisphaerales bacterium]|nr:type 4a pilus biogenesis protein PilO [Phycisphaerales bacterium]